MGDLVTGSEGSAASQWRMWGEGCVQGAGAGCPCLALLRGQRGEEGVAGAASHALITRAVRHWVWTPL